MGEIIKTNVEKLEYYSATNISMDSMRRMYAAHGLSSDKASQLATDAIAWKVEKSMIAIDLYSNGIKADRGDFALPVGTDPINLHASIIEEYLPAVAKALTGDYSLVVKIIEDVAEEPRYKIPLVTPNGEVFTFTHQAEALKATAKMALHSAEKYHIPNSAGNLIELFEGGDN